MFCVITKIYMRVGDYGIPNKEARGTSTTFKGEKIETHNCIFKKTMILLVIENGTHNP